MRNVVAHEYGNIDLETVWATSEAGIMEPVSYTHLDVYKRQQLDDAVFFEDLTRWLEADPTAPLERIRPSEMCIRDSR